MSRGGYRPGAGRKKGAKTKLTERAIRDAGEGVTPLEFMLGLLRDEQLDMLQRFEAAKAAAPYVHARQIESKIQSENVNYNVSDAPLTEDEWEAEYAAEDTVEPPARTPGRVN